MKRIISILLAALIAFASFTVSAADPSTVFTVVCENEESTAEATVMLSANGGISAAAVNIIYDPKLLALEGYTKGSALGCDVVSVNDNGFGQIRFAFCDSCGYFRSTGELLKLRFRRLSDDAFDAVVYIKIEGKAVFDTNYKEATFSCVPGTITFRKHEEAPPPEFASSLYTIDDGALIITDIPPMTLREDFITSFGCPVTVTPVTEYISNGSTVIPDTDDDRTPYTAIVMGDLNCNGRLDAADYIILRRILLGIISPPDIALLSGDMNGNGRLNAADYIILRRILLGII